MKVNRSKDWKLGYSWFFAGRHKSCLWGCSDDVYAGWERAECDFMKMGSKSMRSEPFVKPVMSYGDHRG